ncbi:MAG: glycosyltransferase family 4 protein [Deltaproteobacteria bacterium]|nr:glycosyltransferase family 4 protein [Deltaproteobacteria bacterium]
MTAQGDRGQGLTAAFVVPWFGKGIPGGAEAEARRTAENLRDAGVTVRILTTCLGGLGTDWEKQVYPPGESVENGLTVLRFPTAPRDGKRFNDLNTVVCRGGRLSPAQERDFLTNMVHSPALFQFVAEHPGLGPFFFIPYLFTTAIWGPLIHPAKSVIIPCLHDEGYARLDAVKTAFETARAVVFHVPAERDLAAGLYRLERTDPQVLGEGIDMDWEADAARFRAKYGLTSPFLLYAGRKDAGKNVPLLINYFNQYIREKRGPENLKLILIGNLSVPIPLEAGDRIQDLGFVPRQDKYDAYAAADLLVQPSLLESFSIVIMEAWLANTPVMVHGGCQVTAEHVERSGGGLPFRDYLHFAESLDILFSRPELRREMAAKGRRYVLDHYSWPAVTDRYLGLLRELAAEPCPEPTTWAPPALAGRAVRPRPAGPAVHQMLSDFAWGDAIGGDVQAIQKALTALGFHSEIFAQNVHERVAHLARPIEDYPAEARPEDVLIFHFSIGHELCDRLPGFPGRKVMRYHNITPARFLEACNPESAQRCHQGREQLARLAPLMELGLGVSPYNCAELTAAGCPRVRVVPILLDLATLEAPPDERVLERFAGHGPKVLHVGRVVPNKCLEDLIKSHYWLTRQAPGARLLLVGSEGGWGPYAQGLRQLAADLPAPGVHFLGHVSFPELMAYYRVADAYLCLSEHEGFCVPLVESMHFGLPIVAYAATGVPGTLGPGGVLLADKNPALVGEVLARVLTDEGWRQRLADSSRARLERFRPARVAAELRDALTQELGLEIPA